MKTIRELVKSKNQKNLIYVAKNENATSEMLNELYENNSYNLAIVEAIASNPNISIETLEKIAVGELTTTIVNNILNNKTTTNVVRNALLLNKEIKEVKKYETVLKELSKNSSLEDCFTMKTKEKIYLANSTAYQNILSILSEEKNRKIRFAVSSNQSLCEALINKIVFTEDQNVLYNLIYNPNTSEEALERIFIHFALFLSKNEIQNNIIVYSEIFKKIYFHKNAGFNLAMKMIEFIKNIENASVKCFHSLIVEIIYNNKDIENQESILLKRKLKEVLNLGERCHNLSAVSERTWVDPQTLRDLRYI